MIDLLYGKINSKGPVPLGLGMCHWGCGPYKTCLNNKLSVLFVCFVALRPKSTANVMAGWSVHLTTLFPGQA